MARKTKRKHYFYDEKLIILIKDVDGRVVHELPGTSARDYDRAMRLLKSLNRECNFN